VIFFVKQLFIAISKIIDYSMAGFLNRPDIHQIISNINLTRPSLEQLKEPWKY